MPTSRIVDPNMPFSFCASGGTTGVRLPPAGVTSPGAGFTEAACDEVPAPVPGETIALPDWRLHCRDKPATSVVTRDRSSVLKRRWTTGEGNTFSQRRLPVATSQQAVVLLSLTVARLFPEGL